MVYRLANNMRGLAAPVQTWQAWSGVQPQVASHPAVGSGQVAGDIDRVPSATSQRGMERLFGTPDAVLRADDDGAKSSNRVYVGAEFTHYADLGYAFFLDVVLGGKNPEAYRDLMRVRTQGVRAQADIEHALSYLRGIIIGGEVIIDAARAHGVSIRLGSPQLAYSYARHSFRGVVDLNSYEFGTEIVLELVATPDILLHELFHAVPLPILREKIRWVDDFPEPPHVNTSDRFAVLREAICENMRLAETLSFGAQCHSYEKEREHRITPIFNEPMMSQLDDAWRRGRWTAVRDAFPQYLPHYEERLGLISVLLALIAKVEGRLNVTDDELEKIEALGRGEMSLKGYVRYLQKYLDRYVSERKLEVPPDFYSIEAIVRRTDLGRAKELGVVGVVDAVFQSLEELEKPRGIHEENAPTQALTAREMPPVASLGDRTTLLAAYSGVVDRFLENPPSSLSREELVSLVSFVRMVPSDVASELAARLKVYLTAGYEDLKVTLGLILYEKGLQRMGRVLVDTSLTPGILADAAPIVHRIMGAEALKECVVKTWDALQQRARDARRTFYGFAADQFMWYDQDLERAAHALFSHPELFPDRVWHDVGTWIFDEIDGVDTTEDEHWLLKMDDEYYGYSPDKYVAVLGEFMGMLSRLGPYCEKDEGLAGTVDRMRSAVKGELKDGYSALAQLVEGAGDASILGLVRHRSSLLGRFAHDEYGEIFDAFPPALKRRVVTLAQLDAGVNYSHPEEILAFAGEITDRIVEVHAAGGMVDTEDIIILFSLLRAAGDARAAMSPADALSYGKAWQPLLDDLTKQDYGPYHEELSKFTPLPFIASDFRVHAEHTVEYDKRQWESGLSTDQVIRFLWMSLYGHAARLLPREDARAYLERGAKYLEKNAQVVDGSLNDVNIAHLIDDVFAPCGSYLMMQAYRHGFTELAREFFDILFRKILKRYPPGREIEFPVLDDKDQKSTFGKDALFIRYAGEYEWMFAMEIERHGADAAGWMRRVRDEVRRGGANVTVDALRFIACNMIDDGETEYLEDMYRLMILKSLMDPGVHNVKATLEQIQSSPLSDTTKDDLLHGFVGQLFDMATAFRGVDLNLIRRLEGLFPWRTPFMRAGDVPHYADTEELLVGRIAGIPELVEADRGKDDRVRLAAFAAAGLPLQRYHRWMTTLFTGEDVPAELSQLGMRKGFWDPLERAGLPHPYTIASQLAPDEAEALLDQHGDAIAGMLAGEDHTPAKRLVGRVLGSELRHLAENRGDVDIGNTHAGRFLLSWLGGRYGDAARLPHLSHIQEVLFSAGPPGTKRLNVARDMLGWPVTRGERQRVFAQATNNLIFSTRVKKRLSALADGPEADERTFMELLLGIRYERHPGRMISNVLLDRLESEPGFKRAYEDAVAGKPIEDPLLVSEIGLGLAAEGSTRIRQLVDTSVVTNVEFVLQALEFLKTYMEVTDDDRYCDGYYFQFRLSLLDAHADRFSSVTGWDFLKRREMRQALQASGHELVQSEELSVAYWELNERVEDIQEILSNMPLVSEVNDVLDKAVGRPVGELGVWKSDPEALDKLIDLLEERIGKARETYRDVIMSDLADRLESTKVPAFIEERTGLERDLLIFIMDSLGSSQRRMLDERLATAETDRERIFHLGCAAHLEKLLQLASVHPAVPRKFQDLFSVFQEDMPHRDIHDVRRTLEMNISSEVREHIDLDTLKPIKEGTIGGVYEVRYRGEMIGLKVIPFGKLFDIDASLQLIRDVRRFLWASRYTQPGARAVDDLLSFYERVLGEELILFFEIENASALKAVLPRGFVVPDPNHTKGELVSDAFIGMNLLYSKRLKQLDPSERACVFRRIDEELIPAMIAGGVIHYDLHPGNLGSAVDRNIVLYDLGRVAKLSFEEQEALAGLQWGLVNRDVERVKRVLRMMGTVRDESAFERVGELLQRIADADDPLEALEEVYPNLADYGYVLNDGFIKLLLMFITWRGTKERFG